MSAQPIPVVCASVEREFERLHATTSQQQIGAIVGLCHSNISRRLTRHQTTDDRYGQLYTAEQLVALMRADDRLAGAVLADSSGGSQVSFDLLRSLLAAAHEMTAAMAADSDGGVEVTPAEREELRAVVLPLIKQLSVWVSEVSDAR